MLAKKPWTMMVYLAADNNLFTFGVDSLRQMKVAAGDSVNILAEFDTGPMNPARRYVFDGQQPIGPIARNVRKEFGPTNAADPENLANFVEWSADNYPAEHYFLVIWGHGGGIDDDFPRQPDNSFVPRHSLLSLFKGTASDFPKGTASDFPKGTASDFPKGTASDFPKGTASDFPKGTASDFPKGTASDFPKGIPDDPATRVLSSYLNVVLKAPLQEIIDVLKIGDDALQSAVIDALKHGVAHALGKQILTEVQQVGNGNKKSGFKRIPVKRLEKLRKGILNALAGDALGKLQNGTLSVLRGGLLSALQRGVLDALQAGVLFELQKAVLKAVHKGNIDKGIKQIRNAAVNAILRFLENGILEVQHSGILDLLQNHTVSPTKSLAFVDHPEDFLTNTGLKEALRRATERIGQKIDILGMDSCNMNMIEIAYEIRDSVDFLVASQADIPDASLPYDRIIDPLVKKPYLSSPDLACETVTNYVAAYKDYISEPATANDKPTLDEPVTLSAVDLDRAQRVIPLFRMLVPHLRAVSRSFAGRQAILAARTLAGGFAQGQFIDLIRFCEALTGAAGNPTLARSSAPGSGISISPEVRHLGQTAKRLIGPLKAAIIKNRVSDESEIAKGTSIYFPIYDPDQEDHQNRLLRLCKKLDFARATGWDIFLTEFLKQQKSDLQVAVALVKPARQESAVPASKKMLSRLARVEKTSNVAASELKAAVKMSRSSNSAVNGVLDGAAQASEAVAVKVGSVVAATKNGGGNGKHHNGVPRV